MILKPVRLLVWFGLLFLLISCGETSSTVPAVQVFRDIQYATYIETSLPPLLLNVYQPGEGIPNPVVVFLHGFDENKEAHESVSLALAERGVLVFTINWPTPNSDVAWRDDGQNFRLMTDAHQCAFRFARAQAEEYGGDNSQIIVVGFSMGARIGITSALAGDYLDVLWEELAVERGGPASQVECLEENVSANVGAFVGIGGRYNSVNYLQSVDTELWEIVSPYPHIGNTPSQQIRLILGELDQNVKYEIQAAFNQLLLDAGYDSSLTLWNGFHAVPEELTTKIVLELIGQ